MGMFTLVIGPVELEFSRLHKGLQNWNKSEE